MVTEHKYTEFLKFLIKIVRSDHIDNESNFLLSVFLLLSLFQGYFCLFFQLLTKLISFHTRYYIIFSGRVTLIIRSADTFCESILPGTTILVIMTSSSSSMVISVSLWL
jgi:hypothetical protein